MSSTKRRGRPPGRVQDSILHIRVTSNFLRTLDKWRKKHELSRAEAVRQLVEKGIANEGKSPR